MIRSAGPNTELSHSSQGREKYFTLSDVRLLTFSLFYIKFCYSWLHIFHFLLKISVVELKETMQMLLGVAKLLYRYKMDVWSNYVINKMVDEQGKLLIWCYSHWVSVTPDWMMVPRQCRDWEVAERPVFPVTRGAADRALTWTLDTHQPQSVPALRVPRTSSSHQIQGGLLTTTMVTMAMTMVTRASLMTNFQAQFSC